jgi:SAM-dependent methyltransferase
MIRSLLSQTLSPESKWRLAILRETLQVVRSRDPVERTCNICGFEGYFRPFGSPIRLDAKCPRCESLERHRMLKLWFDQNQRTFDDTKILHFAAEKAVTRFVRACSSNYVTADIQPGRCDLVLNVEAINLPDSQYGVVICSHVLEHVDDRAALRELFRITGPGGIVLLMTPMVEGWDATFEDRSKATEQERWLYFGQGDHLRFYGSDFRDRITAAGFDLEEFTAVEPDVSRHGLVRGEKVFVARRPD